MCSVIRQTLRNQETETVLTSVGHPKIERKMGHSRQDVAQKQVSKTFIVTIVLKYGSVGSNTGFIVRFLSCFAFS